MVIDLRARCARYFTYADLIECGDTWQRLRREGNGVPNAPLRDESYEGIAALAATLLDPLVDHFGSVEITYGFAGPALTRHIARSIAPPLDQHAGSELNARGSLVCARRGQSCDLRVPGVDALTVAAWVRARLPFDRVYLYGLDRPLHVSHAPEPVGKVFAMCPGARGAVPRDMTRRGADEIAAMFADVSAAR